MEISNPYRTPIVDVEITQQEYQTPKVFTLNSRIGRFRYFAYSIFYAVIALSIAMPIAMVFDDVIGELGSSILMMVIVIPAYAAAMKRRLNDLGRSDRWLLLGFIPVIGGIWALYLLFAAGESVENKYGLAPDKNGKVLLCVVSMLCIVIFALILTVLLPAYQTNAERVDVNMASQVE